MVRVPGLMALAMLTIAAAPPKSDFSTFAVLEQSTLGAAGRATTGAVPALGGFSPAPVPDIDLVPHPRQEHVPAAELSADLFTNKKTYRGEGYLPGSTVQGSQERHVNPAPGFSLKVPLE